MSVVIASLAFSSFLDCGDEGRLVRVQQVLPRDGSLESWTVLNELFAVIEPADAFLAHLTAIERSPGTVRAYALDLRDYFEFLAAHEIDWRAVRLEHLSRFIGWLRLPPTTRTASLTPLSTIEPRCSAPTIKMKTRRRLPRALSEKSAELIVDSCDRLRDRFLIELLAGTGMRIGEALGLRHQDIDASTLIRIRARRNVNGARVAGGQRDVPVPPWLIRIHTDYLVEEYGDLDCDYVFVNLRGGSVGTKGPRTSPRRTSSCAQLALAHGQRRAAQIASVTTLSSRQVC